MIYRINLVIALLCIAFIQLQAQENTRAYKFTGIVYDEYFNPLPYTHVLAAGTGQGDVTDSLGIFIILPVGILLSLLKTATTPFI